MRTYDLGSDVNGAEESAIHNRRRLAELLMAQSSQGPAFSKGAGIAKALSMALAMSDLKGADKDAKDLAGRRESERTADMDRMFEFVNQKEPLVGPGMPQVDDEGNQMPGNVQDTAAKRQELAKMLMRARTPQVAQFGLQELLKEPPKPATYKLNKGEVVKDASGRVIADNPEAPKVEGPKRGELRKVLKGGAEEQQEWDGGQWTKIGEGPRWAPPSPAAIVNVNGPKENFKNEKTLRDEFTESSKSYVKIRDAYSQVKDALAGDITAASTLAGATKFMKMLDPESVVRESELQMALKSTGMLDRFMNLHNTVMKGGVLTPTQAKEIQRIAGVLYNTAETQQRRVSDHYTKLAKDYELEPSRVVRDLSPASAPAAAGGPVRIQSDADFAALPSGATFIGPDGKTRRKP